jgi:Dihydroorotate dehydrogenase.
LIYTHFEPYPTLFGEGAYSGLSGPAIKPITLRTIAEIAKNVDIVISGNGGAFNLARCS